MKYISRLLTGMAAIAALTFTACSDDNTETVPEGPKYQTIEVSIDPDKADTQNKGVEFTAEGSWTLTSNQPWCQLSMGETTANSLTGGAGQQTIYIVIDKSVATSHTLEANITLTTGGQSYVLAHVTLGAVTYRGIIKHNNSTHRSSSSKNLHVMEDNDNWSISANYDFHIEMPEWCLIDGKRSFVGEKDKEYPVQFSFNTECGIDKRYPIKDGLFIFAGESKRDTFTIAYMGMDKYLIDINIEPGQYGWTINADEQIYTHYNSTMEDVSLTTPYIPFSIQCRNDKAVFVYVTKNDKSEYEFNLSADYVTIEDLGDAHYNFKLAKTDHTPKWGKLMAFPVAAWDTIKANPKKALLEETEWGLEWEHETEKNDVVEWKLYKESKSPFSLIVNAQTWDMEEFDPEYTEEYNSKFGCSEAWVIKADMSTTNLLIRLEGYEQEWYENGEVYAGFSASSMKHTPQELEEMGFEPMNEQLHNTPAFQVSLKAPYNEMAKTSEMYIAYRHGGKTQLLVIRPL